MFPYNYNNNATTTKNNNHHHHHHHHHEVEQHQFLHPTLDSTTATATGSPLHHQHHHDAAQVQVQQEEHHYPSIYLNTAVPPNTTDMMIPTGIYDPNNQRLQHVQAMRAFYRQPQVFENPMVFDANQDSLLDQNANRMDQQFVENYQQVLQRAAPQPPQMNYNAGEFGVINVEKMVKREKLPPGYRFVPSEQELVCYYLKRKVDNNLLYLNWDIHDVTLYNFHPHQLIVHKKVRICAENHTKFEGQSEWYFFTPRERKYQNGRRPRRSVSNGYWKPTGKDKTIFHNNHPVGYKKVLDFYQGKHPGGNRTDLKMHEYRLQQRSDVPKTDSRSQDRNQLDRWVLCKIYKKERRNQRDNDEEVNDRVPSNDADNNSMATEESALDSQSTNTDKQLQPNNYNIAGSTSLNFASSSIEKGLTSTTSYDANTDEFAEDYIIDQYWPNSGDFGSPFL